MSTRTARTVAIVTGILGALAAIITPLLPVQQDNASISWPQAGSLTSVEAPLVSYVPLRVTATVPCSVIADATPGATLVSTVAPGALDGRAKGMQIVRTDLGATVVLRDRVLTSVLAGERCTNLTVTADGARTVATLLAPGLEPRVIGTVEADVRPQTVGVFTTLTGPAPTGLAVTVDIDSRFSSTPSLAKIIAIVLAAAATVASLIALHALDGTDHRRARRVLPRRWRPRAVDGVVVGVLAVWHVVGANTSDDGYLLTMARVSEKAGYMANYYRWFGVPEAPFGMPYYDMLALLSRVSTASPWMRLPTLLAALVCWFLISREVIPRLGVAVRTQRTAVWTAALVFLAFWLPFNNGLRPEPIIALGALLTWCSIERAIATGRLLPAAIAVIVAAFSLAAGPTGLICIAALLSGARPLLAVLVRRARTVGFAALLAPLLAAGTVVIVAMFADQTVASVLEATRVRSAVGPNVKWFDEYFRWDALLAISPDGSLARRFGVFVMLLSLITVVMVMLRRGGHIPGTAVGPSRRIVGIVIGSLALMMFTPTKWTHHFGVYAGLAASLAALAAVAVVAVPVRSPRNRTLFTAAVLFLTALAFTGSNGWWYVSSYGVPWFDKPPSVAGKGFATLLLGLSVLTLAVAAYQHLRVPFRPAEKPHPRRFSGAALPVIAAFVVAFEVLSLLKGAISQYPAYSVGRSNVDALAGQTCGLARDVEVEQDPTASVLPALTTPGIGPDHLAGSDSAGFTPDGVAADLTADTENTTVGGANSIDTTDGKTRALNTAGTSGGSEEATGVNGSRVSLPFGLDPARVPVLGSYTDGPQKAASLRTGWYSLPTDRRTFLAVAVAGRIFSVDKDGVVTPGQSLLVEFARVDGTAVRPLGTVVPLDIGPQPSWRNVRIPAEQIPADANAVRLVADDPDLSADQWLAVTPPRMPITRSLDDVVGHTSPVLLDWSVGLAFGCQRPFDHRNGVAEAPQWRILPDRVGADSTNAWQDAIGGGPLGWTPLLLRADTVPSYLRDDLARDWGSLEQFTQLDGSAVSARVDVTKNEVSGLWSPGLIKYR